MNILNRIWFLLAPGYWWIVGWWFVWSCLFTLWYGAEWASPFFVLLGLNTWKLGRGQPCRQ